MAIYFEKDEGAIGKLLKILFDLINSALLSLSSSQPKSTLNINHHCHSNLDIKYLNGAYKRKGTCHRCSRGVPCRSGGASLNRCYIRL